MSPEECLKLILEDAQKIDQGKLEKLSIKKKDVELEKITKRWLGWIRSVREEQEWDTGCGYHDEEE